MISHHDIVGLARADDGLSLSLYLPYVTAPDAAHQNRVRLRNAVRQAREAADAFGTAGQALVEKAEAMIETLDLPSDPNAAGLALVCAEQAPCRCWVLPIDPGEAAVLDRGYHLRPLLPLFGERQGFYVIALEQDDPRLICARPHSAHLVADRMTVESLDKIRGLTELPADVGFHPSGPANAGPGDSGAADAQYHALGESPDDYRQQQLNEYALRIAQAVDQALNQDQAPLVAVGDPNLLGMFRKHCHYGGLVDAAVDKSPARLDAADLAELARPIAEPLLDRSCQEALDKLAEGHGRGETWVALRHEPVLQAARDGRVDTLFLDPDAPLQARMAELRAPDDAGLHGRPVDLGDEMVRQTLSHGGRVFAIAADRLPKSSPAAALMRY